MGLSSSGSVAFTPPKSPLPALPPQLRSALVEEIDAIAVQPPQTQQLIEEEQFVSPTSPDAPTDATSYHDNGIHTLFDQTDGNLVVTALVSIATIVSSWLAADFGSGVLHWSVDNYGNGRTPIMGNIIAAFQGHHSAPWTITYRGFANNVHKLCIPFGVPTVAAITYLAGPENPMVSLFFSVFCFTEIMSQEFHKWSRQTKKEVPGWVNTLQDVGVTIGRPQHNKHHIAPYDGNYCIVSGLCNKLMDESGFFRRLEHRIYAINGVEANSWKLDPKLRLRTLEGNYRLPSKLRR